MNAGDHDGPASEQDTSIVEALARETGREAAHVKELYEREFAKLEATAKVHGFLSIFAYRNVRTTLNNTRTDTN
jgi:Protein of unknown function (DUF3562)